MKEQNNEEILLERKEPEKLSRKSRFLIFLLFFILSNLLENNEEIIFSQISNTNKKDYFIFSNFLYIIVLQIENRKSVTFAFFLVIGILYIILSLFQNIKIFMVAKLFISGLQHYKDIFIPVWIDQFGIKRYKTLLMYIYLNNLFGNIISKLAKIIINLNIWNINCLIFGILIIILDCLLLFFHKIYFSLNYNFVGYKIEGKEEYINSENGQESFFEKQEDKNNSSEDGFLKTIIKNKIYIFSVMTLFFYSFSYKFFLVDISFINNAISYGLFFGGICLLCLGGYENKNSTVFLGISSIISFFSLLIIVFSTQTFMFFVFLFIFFSLPMITIIKCYVISSLPNKFRGSGFAFSSLLENISLMISPIFSEFLTKNYHKNMKYLELNFYIIIYIVAFICCLLLLYYKCKDNQKEAKKDDEKELENIENVS